MHNKHISRYGCLGIFCGRNRITSAFLGGQAEGITIEDTTEVEFDGIENYKLALENLLVNRHHKSTPVYIGISAQEASYDVIQISSLPKNKSSKEPFIRWRYEKEYGHRLNEGPVRFAQLDKGLAAVASGSTLLKETVDIISASNAQTQWVGPIVLCYPKLLLSLVDSSFRANSIVLHITSYNWTLAFIRHQEIFYCRTNAWIASKELSFEFLMKDLQRLTEYFSSSFQLENNFPIYFIDDGFDPSWPTGIFEESNFNIFHYSASDCISRYGKNMKNNYLCVNAFAAAVTGMKSYD